MSVPQAAPKPFLDTDSRTNRDRLSELLVTLDGLSKKRGYQDAYQRIVKNLDILPEEMQVSIKGVASFTLKLGSLPDASYASLKEAVNPEGRIEPVHYVTLRRDLKLSIVRKDAGKCTCQQGQELRTFVLDHLSKTVQFTLPVSDIPEAVMECRYCEGKK